ncbi:MAG: zinc-dependent alcohol dehydrogenase family protein [Proteobacteria bacterium]|nr:zinc-dependent alcohol dehydrogenase family protein [Pseudomonadota bacterium]
MRAMVVARPAPIEDSPLALLQRELAAPGPGQVRLEIEACGVCRTDLHVAEGDLPPRRRSVVPGHEVVGRVGELGPGCTRFRVGDRVGLAWVQHVCGECRHCRDGRENLCLEPQFTGWSADGGYAEACVAPEDFLYELPQDLTAEQLAPLLCAGIIGYRALLRAEVAPGKHLGLYGFGGSAHIAIQVARYWGCEVSVFTRGGRGRALATELGAGFVGEPFERPPRALDAAVVFAPSGDIVPPALAALDRGGVLAIAGIHLSDIPALDYEQHLFQERELRSVTANTRQDGRALLALAAEIPIRTHTRSYPLESANQALADLKHGRLQGAAVLVPGTE